MSRGNERELTWGPSSNFRRRLAAAGLIGGCRAARRTRGPILILPVDSHRARGGRNQRRPRAGSRAQRRGAVVVAARHPDFCNAGDVHPPIRHCRNGRPARLLLARRSARCSGGDFGRTREDMRSDDMHRWLGAEATGSVGLTSFAIPAHRRGTPASRSRLSPDRAAAFAPGLEEPCSATTSRCRRPGGRRSCSTAPPMAAR